MSALAAPPAASLPPWSVYLVALCVLVVLAIVHAGVKLSSGFAWRWFVGAALFGATWGLGGRLAAPSAAPLALLVPAFVFYVAAAVTKGIVESTDALAGRHVVHVLMTGVFAVAIAWPHEVLWREGGWVEVSPASARALAWGVAAFLFYGAYKLVDHARWPAAARVLVLLLAMPALGAALAASIRLR